MWYDDGALVWYLDRDGKQCQTTLSYKNANECLDFSEGLLRLKSGDKKFLVHSEYTPAIMRDYDKIGSDEDALIYVNHGKLHNLTNSATLTRSGAGEYYIHGYRFSKKEFEGIKSEGLTCTYSTDGILSFHKNGKIHRDGGPALYYTDEDGSVGSVDFKHGSITKMAVMNAQISRQICHIVNEIMRIHNSNPTIEIDDVKLGALLEDGEYLYWSLPEYEREEILDWIDRKYFPSEVAEKKVVPIEVPQAIHEEERSTDGFSFGVIAAACVAITGAVSVLGAKKKAPKEISQQAAVEV